MFLTYKLKQCLPPELSARRVREFCTHTGSFEIFQEYNHFEIITSPNELHRLWCEFQGICAGVQGVGAKLTVVCKLSQVL